MEQIYSVFEVDFWAKVRVFVPPSFWLIQCSNSFLNTHREDLPTSLGLLTQHSLYPVSNRSRHSKCLNQAFWMLIRATVLIANWLHQLDACFELWKAEWCRGCISTSYFCWQTQVWKYEVYLLVVPLSIL